MRELRAERLRAGAGGGPFRIGELTLGVFLTDQPSHRLSVGSDRRQHRPLSARQGWIMPAGAEGVCEFDAPLDFVTVSLPRPLLREVGLSRTIAPSVGALDPLVVELALSAPSFRDGSAMYRETMARALAAQLVAVAAPAPGAARALDDVRLKRAAGYVHGHLAEDISLERLAAEAGMSAFHFARSFKAAVGASPLQYVIKSRIEAARTLLRTTRLPVAEIAHRVGYGDVSRFAAHFRRETGTTPGAFRAE